MDSCNSGSLQSSSNGDEEYDSRAESISTFFNSSSSSSLPHYPPPPQPPSTSHHHHPSSSFFFDPLSSYFDAFPRSPPPPPPPPPSDPNPFIPTTSAWTSRAPRPSPPPSEPTCTADTSLIPSSLMSPISASDLRPYSGAVGASAAPRGPKKRSRASRRAPTTVLTTDTSNFRAMVQEFTGIPTPPFGSSSLPFSRPRLDLLHTAALPPYLLRPFAHKAQVHPPSLGPMPPSSMLGTIPCSVSTNANTSINATTAVTTSATTAVTTSDIGLGIHQHHELLNMGSPMFAFQSLLQPPLTPAMPTFGERSQAPPAIALMDYGMGHLGHAGSSARVRVGPEDGDRAQSRTVIARTAAARGEGVVDSWIIPSE